MVKAQETMPLSPRELLEKELESVVRDIQAIEDQIANDRMGHPIFVGESNVGWGTRLHMRVSSRFKSFWARGVIAVTILHKRKLSWAVFFKNRERRDRNAT